jgi:soluble lytic murein transglycosylase-like protein
VIRVAVVALGTATLPLPVGTAPLGASAKAHDAFAPSMAAPLADIGRRLDNLDAVVGDIELVVRHEIDPLVRVLTGRYKAPQPLASQIAVALVREGRRTNLDARLLLAVILVENPWIDGQARSFMGAVGLMQVMPFHAGEWGCPGADLTDPDVNICHGASILAHAMVRTDGDLDQALLRYNGCVLGTNTPDCHRYPEWVRRRLAHVTGVEYLTEDRPGRRNGGPISAHGTAAALTSSERS